MNYCVVHRGWIADGTYELQGGRALYDEPLEELMSYTMVYR